MLAVIQTGGKQYCVKPGDVINVERLEGKQGDVVELGKVLMSSGKFDSSVSAKVKAEILENGKTDKVIVFKKKRRQGYRRKQGHRQNITTLRIKEVK